MELETDTYTFLCVSVGIKFVTIGQADEAKQHSKK